MEAVIRKQRVLHDNDEDRYKSILASKRRYGKQPWHCEHCNITCEISNKAKHLKTKKHDKNMENYIS